MKFANAHANCGTKCGFTGVWLKRIPDHLQGILTI